MRRNEIFKITLDIIEKLVDASLNLEKVSDYNQKYVKEYCNNPSFYASLYSQLLVRAIHKLDKSMDQSVFIDYGGGCGLLSYVAKKMGFKTVVYNDIYDVSLEDAKEISRVLNFKVDHFICGEIDEVQEALIKKEIIPDVICSFNVLEHIYNLDEWFQKLKSFQAPFSLYFMTSANGRNPYIRKHLQKIHHQAEYLRKEKGYGWKERDTSLAFQEVRKKIISEHDSNIEASKVELLAIRTRGLRKEDIIAVVEEYKKTNKIETKLPYSTNTCDPYTGNWAENMIDLKTFRKMLEDVDTTVRFTNSKYGYTSNKIVTLVKFFINGIIGVLGKENLFLSPSYILELDFKK